MRIAHVLPGHGFSGSERFVLSLIRWQRAHGCACAVALLFDHARWPERMPLLLDGCAAEVFRLRMRHWGESWRLPRLYAYLRFWRPDVVHCYSFEPHVAGALLRAAGLSTRLVWTHTTIPDPARRARKFHYRLLAPYAHAQAHFSEAVRAAVRTIIGAGRSERVIFPGFDLTPFLAVRPAAEPVIGSAGRLVAHVKGFDVLIRAFARLARENPEVRLRIAGTGRDGDALAELARKEGVAERVEFVGFVADMASFLSGVSVVAVPSRREAVAATLIEGMAAGRPCIASRTGGLPEVGGDLVTYVRPGDVADLHVALRQVLASPPSAEQAARQRRRMMDLFSLETAGRQYDGLYRSLCGMERGSVPSDA